MRYIYIQSRDLIRGRGVGKDLGRDVAKQGWKTGRVNCEVFMGVPRRVLAPKLCKLFFKWVVIFRLSSTACINISAGNYL